MDLITDDRLMLQVEPAGWEDLVRRSAAPLEHDSIIEPRYVEAILDSVRRNGSYMVIAPRVLLAHARPEEGALGTGLSLLTTTGDVAFDDQADTPVRLFFTLAASDADTHLELLTHLATVLVDEKHLTRLTTSSDTAQVRAILTPGS